MKILLTGGAGFIGSALVRQLIRETDHQVVNLDKLTYAGNLESLAETGDDPRHRFERGELGWRPRETFETGLRRTVAWYLANEPWCRNVQSGGYRQERLGLGGRS